MLLRVAISVPRPSVSIAPPSLTKPACVNGTPTYAATRRATSASLACVCLWPQPLKFRPTASRLRAAGCSRLGDAVAIRAHDDGLVVRDRPCDERNVGLSARKLGPPDRLAVRPCHPSALMRRRVKRHTEARASSIHARLSLHNGEGDAPESSRRRGEKRPSRQPSRYRSASHRFPNPRLSRDHRSRSQETARLDQTQHRAGHLRAGGLTTSSTSEAHTRAG